MGHLKNIEDWCSRHKYTLENMAIVLIPPLVAGAAIYAGSSANEPYVSGITGEVRQFSKRTVEAVYGAFFIWFPCYAVGLGREFRASWKKDLQMLKQC